MKLSILITTENNTRHYKLIDDIQQTTLVDIISVHGEMLDTLKFRQLLNYIEEINKKTLDKTLKI